MSVISIKVVVVGDGGVGKTSLLMRYTQHTFPTDYVPTVFDNFSERMVVQGQPVDIGLWDTAGQESYDRLRPLAYPNTDVFLLCFSLSQRESLENVRLKWINELNEHVPEAQVILVGTQADRIEKNAPISTDGLNMSRRINAFAYMECSALTGENVSSVFEQAVRLALQPEVKQKKRRWLPKCLTS